VKTVSDKVVRLHYDNISSTSYRHRIENGLTLRAKMIGEERPLLRENLARTNPPAFKTPILDLFSPVAPQP